MLAHVIVAVALTVTVAGCRRDPKPPPNQPSDPLLIGLEPPPLNKPVHEPPGEQRVTIPQLPPGPASALVVTRGGRPFIGVANLTGRLIVGANRIQIQPAQDSALEILYRLPPGLPALTAATTDGSIAVTERNEPAGADQLVLVRGDSRLVLAEVWQRSLRPLSVDLGNGLRLQQRSAQPVATGGYAEAPLDVLDGARVVTRVPIGRATEIQAAAGRYAVLVEVSHLFTQAPSDKEQFGSGYILRAWVVPAR
jgi:hypothetical protein